MSQQRTRSQHLVLTLVAVCLIKHTQALSSSTSGGLLAGSATFDLKRLSALPVSGQGGDNRAEHPSDQVTAAATTASHESFLNVGGGGLNPLLRLLAATSSPMPLGMRRLDGDGVPGPSARELHEVIEDRDNQHELLVTAASRSGRSKNPYSNIVDNGNHAGQISSSSLTAKTAISNDYNRLALASALEYQRALASQQARKIGGGQYGRHQVSRKWSRSASGRARNKYDDELSSRSGGDDDVDGEESSGSTAAADEDEDAPDGDENEAKRPASRRQSADGFEDQTDEELNADNDDEEELRSPAQGRKQVVASRQQHLVGRRQSGQAKSLNSRRRSSGAAHLQRGRSQRTEGAAAAAAPDEEGESSNTRQLRAKVDGGSGGGGGQRQAHERQQERMVASIQRQMMAAAAVAATERKEDDLSSASHVLNSKTDLQAAAGHHHSGHHGHYYQYVEVPKKKAWKFGFKRGNHKHEIEKHEKGHKHKFHTEFKWHAKEKKHKSVGKMVWDYKHAKKHHH